MLQIKSLAGGFLSRVPFLPLVLIAAVGCGGGGDAGPTPPPTPPTISASSSSLELRGLGAEQSVSASPSPASLAVGWTSENPSVATVTANGSSATVRAIAAGTTTLVASVTQGSQRAEARIAVTVVPIARSISLSAAATRVFVGSTVQVTPTVIADAGAATTLSWSVNEPTRATVSAQGIVTGVAAGPVTVTATSTATSTVSAQTIITVDPRPQVRSVVVAPSSDSALVGATKSFTANVAADSTLSTAVTWRSSSAAVATVSASGVATAVGAGVATITAVSVADTMVRGTAQFSVRAPAVRTIAVSAPLSIVAGSTEQATATVTADPGVSQAVTWSSSTPAVATVSASGQITALSAGSTTIRATSVATPSVSGSVGVTVTAPPFFAAWLKSKVGIVGNQYTDGLAQGLISLSSSMALSWYWEFADGTSPNRLQLLQNGVVRDVMPAGASLVGQLTSIENGVAFGVRSGSDAVVMRWDGNAFSPLTGTQPAPALSLQALPNNRVAMWSQQSGTGRVHVWDNGAWTLIFSVVLPGNVTNFNALWMRDLNAAVVVIGTTAGTHQIVRWDGTTTSIIPNIGGNPVNSTPPIVGSSLTNLYALTNFGHRVSRWDGLGWDGMAGLPAADSSFSITMCGTQPVVVSRAGRVFRRESNVWVRLGTDANNLPNRFFGTASRGLSCASDTTLRTSGGDGSLARWTGTDWVVETFAPSLRTVHLVNQSLGWASGGGFSIYRYNGSTWSLALRGRGDTDRRVGSITAWSDGRMVGALWSSISPLGPTLSGFPAQGIVRFDGTTWQYDLSLIVQLVNGVWGTSYTNTFAASGDGRILRFDGGGWNIVYSGVEPLTHIGGVGLTHALALGNGMRTVRWDGTTWTSVTALPGVNPSRLHVAGVNNAWAAAGNAIYRFDGSTWTSIDVSAIGGAQTTYAIFGTNVNDVYVLRATGTTAGAPRALYRWNGTTWSTITGFSATAPEWMESGHAIPGLGMITGNNGNVFVSTANVSAIQRRK
ncbi:MAG: Ig-like domain-containing protein [Gemmatimonadaceae bacterium]|nr:Ig-like domain-containing protein [Gemmatimonadaceae bacterium]